MLTRLHITHRLRLQTGRRPASFDPCASDSVKTERHFTGPYPPNVARGSRLSSPVFSRFDSRLPSLSSPGLILSGRRSVSQSSLSSRPFRSPFPFPITTPIPYYQPHSLSPLPAPIINPSHPKALPVLPEICSSSANRNLFPFHLSSDVTGFPFYLFPFLIHSFSAFKICLQSLHLATTFSPIFLLFPSSPPPQLSLPGRRFLDPRFLFSSLFRRM